MPIKNIAALKKILKGFDVDALIAAIINIEEVEVTIPDVIVATNAELLARDENLKSTNINVGKELLIKELKTKAGLDYTGEGSKDPDKFITEYSKKVAESLGKSEGEKVAEANKVIEALRKNLETAQKEKGDLINSQKQATVKQKYLENTLDKKPENFTNDEWITLLTMGVQLDEDGGIEVAKKGGEIMRDPITQKPLAIKDALHSYIEERKLGKVVDDRRIIGRDGKDSKAPISGISNMKQYVDHLTAQGIPVAGDKARIMLQEITATNPNFDFNTK